MSSAFFSDFFPDLTKVLRTQYPLVWNHLFPANFQAKCPELHYVWQHHEVRTPYLLPIALAAGLCGLMGFFKNKNTRQLAFCRAVCLFFGLMNFSAIGAHCLFPRGSIPWKVAVSLDVCCTGCAAIFLAIGVYLTNGIRQQQLLITSITVAIFGGYGLACALSIPYANEFTYLVITLVASAVVAFMVFTRFLQAEAASSYTLACVGALMALLSLPLDRYLCTYFGSYINLSHLLFAGCLVIIYNLERYIVRLAKKEKLP